VWSPDCVGGAKLSSCEPLRLAACSTGTSESVSETCDSGSLASTELCSISPGQSDDDAGDRGGYFRSCAHGVRACAAMFTRPMAAIEGLAAGRQATHSLEGR